MPNENIDSGFKTRINDLLLLNEALVRAVDAFYVEFGDNELEAVRVAYMHIAVLIMTRIEEYK